MENGKGGGMNRLEMKNHGPCVYFDRSTKGGRKNKPINRYRADITVDGVCHRRRGRNRAALEKWIASVRKQGGKA
jgi:hypothetical protein